MKIGIGTRKKSRHSGAFFSLTDLSGERKMNPESGLVSFLT
ncbi:MAG: hypothetical protein PHD48_04410 [Alphaproteobacteria bacterium]|nr:hypothetical protein [Alphaproteobacteria bacterium]